MRRRERGQQSTWHGTNLLRCSVNLDKIVSPHLQLEEVVSSFQRWVSSDTDIELAGEAVTGLRMRERLLPQGN